MLTHVASIRRRPEDVLCGITPIRGCEIKYVLSVLHTTHTRRSNSWNIGIVQVHPHLHNLPQLSRSQLSFSKPACLFMLIFLKSNIISCSVGRHFEGPRSQSHFNVVISYASLAAQRWILKSRDPRRLYVNGWRR